MSNIGQLSPKVQERIQKFQQLQNTMQQLTVQKQKIDLEMSESERALETLQEVEGDTKVFKSVGAILVEKTRDELIDELNERQDFLEMRSNVLEKQEKKTRQRLNELQETLQKDLNLSNVPSV